MIADDVRPTTIATASIGLSSPRPAWRIDLTRGIRAVLTALGIGCIASVAIVCGVMLAVPGWGRMFGVTILVAGALFALLSGSSPVRGIGGTPSVLWLEERIFTYGFTTGDTGGYGLPRSREILAHYGGSIVVESSDSGQGATFALTLRVPSELPPGRSNGVPPENDRSDAS